MQQTEERCTGIVKFYNRQKGFGYITLDSGKVDVYLHRSAVQGDEDARLTAGVHVSLSIVKNDKGPSAKDVVVISDTKKPAAKREAPPTRQESGKGKQSTAVTRKEQPRKGEPQVPATRAETTRVPRATVVEKPRTDTKPSAPAGATTTPAKPGTRLAKAANESIVDAVKKASKAEAKALAALKGEPLPPVQKNAPASQAPAEDGDGFQSLALMPSLLRAVGDAGYVHPTPIQAKAIPLVLARKDVLGCAQTGTGKTAAFALPILQQLASSGPASKDRPAKRPVRALILSPTRELAIQIDECFQDYGKYTGLKHAVIFGGVGQDPQVKALQAGVDVLVATPGRLLDLMGQGFASIATIEIFVLDEADRMLDMGFIHDVRRIVKELPKKRQTLLFSATMPAEIIDLAKSVLNNPVEVRVSPEKITLDEISQSIYFVPKKQKPLLLIDLLVKNARITRALVFTRTKHGANQVVKKLVKAGIPALAIHGNKSQSARQKALGDFKNGDLRVLVATDVASRGIDVDEISHVIQFDLPDVPETYVHRIGRTGRMGASGSALAFCDDAEKDCLRDIEKLLKKRVPVVADHPFKA
ncbi:MAG: DEAD/DEAH box helicase [Candidatus Lokiarchaeota archaeon]|nr:DEAD/DEAH box helicase [Candidatus Lokiarchaeota archaeon]